MKPKKQKLTLNKQFISNLSDANTKKIIGGFHTDPPSSIAETCKCSFPPKCASDKII